MFWCTCAECGIKKIQICKIKKLDQPVLGAGVMDTEAGTALDMFVHHGLPWMGKKKKTVELGRYYGSEALRDPKLQEKSYRLGFE